MVLNSITLDDQLLKSRRVLAAWQWMSTISTRPDEVVRLLQTEARLLAGLAMQHPEKAASVAQLIDAYTRLAGSVQKRRGRDAARHMPAGARQPQKALDIC